MYATCLFCNSALGANEALEHFPVGRRLAYDAAKGRLWVVCRKCERWNLSPLETRWEAIEEAEKAFRATRMRVSSDNIGMAQLKEGVELVRIGAAERPEFAAWRYGDQFGKRRRKYRALVIPILALPLTGAAISFAHLAGTISFPALKAAFAGWTSVGGAISVAGSMSAVGFGQYLQMTAKLPRTTVRDENGAPMRLTHRNAGSARLFPASRLTDWHLRLPSISVQPASGWLKRLGYREMELQQMPEVTLTGAVAMRALGTILPSVNMLGGDKTAVQDAVNTINNSASVEQLLRHGGFPDQKLENHINLIEHRNMLSVLQPHFRLALEMALHDGDEQRAMDGELKELEQRWREADEIAQIADAMFLPEEIGAQVEAEHSKAWTRSNDVR